MSSDWLTVQMAELFHQETTRNVIFKPSLTLASTILQKRSQSISLKHLLPKPPPSVYFPIRRHVGMMTEKAKVFVYRRATQTFCAEHHSCHSQGFSIQVQWDPSTDTPESWESSHRLQGTVPTPGWSSCRTAPVPTGPQYLSLC